MPSGGIDGNEHRGHTAFDVACSAAEQPPVDHGRGKRLDRHPFRGDGVLMSVPEDHRSVGEGRVEAGDDVVTPRMNGLSPMAGLSL